MIVLTEHVLETSYYQYNLFILLHKKYSFNKAYTIHFLNTLIFQLQLKSRNFLHLNDQNYIFKKVLLTNYFMFGNLSLISFKTYTKKLIPKLFSKIQFRFSLISNGLITLNKVFYKKSVMHFEELLNYIPILLPSLEWSSFLEFSNLLHQYKT